MPEISRFFGIIIAMFYNEHNPPHFMRDMASTRLKSIYKLCRYWLENFRREPWDWSLTGQVGIKMS